MSAEKPPFDDDAEKALLGTVLYRGQAGYDEVEGLVATEDFYAGTHRHIFDALTWLSKAGEPIDATTVAMRIADMGRAGQVGGTEAMVELINATAVCTASALKTYARGIRSKAKLRKLIDLAREIQAEAHEPVEDVAAMIGGYERRLGGIVEEGAEDAFVSVKQALIEASHEMQARAKNNGRPDISSGWREVDALTGGIHRSDLTIVAGRPGHGKTAWAMNLVDNVATEQRAALVYSLEMPRRQLAMRMVCSDAGESVAVYRHGGNVNWNKLAASGKRVSSKAIYFDDSSQPTVDTIRGKTKRKAKALEREGKRLSIVVIDYLQLMKLDDPKNVVRALQDITSGLKALAKELDIPVVCLSQLNRGCEERPDKRPRPSDLRESGAIEQDADNIFFIFREEVYHPEKKGAAELIVAKQRNGPPGTVSLFFDGKSTTFRSLDEGGMEAAE